MARPPLLTPLGVLGLVLLGSFSAGGVYVFADWWVCLPTDLSPTYVGRDSCIKCHAAQHAAWHGSDHDRAMDLATPETVLGDFDNAEFTHFDIVSRMFRRDGRYFIHTEGPAGQMADFEIKYVFGVDPLQQYMVEFDRTPDMAPHEIARVQVLRISWDTHGKRWFYLPPPDVSEKLAPDDDLHWTGIAQRWNNMCADCHSTNLQKNFDHHARAYRTTFSEIDVSCEACHGPGSAHVALATSKSFFWDRKLGYGLPQLKAPANAETEIQMCAKCHSRRSVVHPDFRPGANFYDHYRNELLRENSYHADGQILDEVYEHGSFLQSKMYSKDIRCTDCHDPHTARTRHEGNKVCTSCHAHNPGKYDSPAHHHHEPGSKGAQCVECHMPASTYMELDPRRDHSLRVPRPDLSVQLGTPNACTGCHLNVPPKSAPAAESPLAVEERARFKQYNDWLIAARQDEAVRAELARLDRWAKDQTKAWFGGKPDAPDHYALALSTARRREPEAEKQLLALLRGRGQPAIVRATSAMHLSQIESAESLEACRKALLDSDPTVRAAALGRFEPELDWAISQLSMNRSTKPCEPLVQLLLPLLSDKTRLVRIEAGRMLARIPAQARAELLSGPERDLLNAALADFQAHLLAENDRAAAHLALGFHHESQGDDQAAEQAYRTALAVEPRTVGPRTNLAALLDARVSRAEAAAEQAGRERDSAALERALAARERHRQEAARLRREELDFLARDAALVPDNADLQYRYGMSLYLHGQEAEAEAALLKAERLVPDSPAPVLALALLYQHQERWAEGLEFAERARRLAPRDPTLPALIEELRARAGR